MGGFGFGFTLIDRSRFEGNRTVGGGALAVAEVAQVRAVDSLFISNTATSAGAIMVALSGLSLVRSAVVSNTATGGDGGGLNGSFGSARIENSTISGNRSSGSGGGVHWDMGTLRAFNATVTNNSADTDADDEGAGGGVAAYRGDAIFTGTIVSGNWDLSPITRTAECDGEFESAGYNLIGAPAGCAITGTLTGNITGSAMLALLAPNGSPFTLSHLPLPGSPARDGGDPSGCKSTAGVPLLIDQRGQARPRDGDGDGVAVCDIGAVEATGAVLYLPITQRAAASSW